MPSLAIYETTFTAAGQKLGDTVPIVFRGPFGVSITGTYTGTILLRVSYDNGATFFTIKAYSGASPITELDRINLANGGMRVMLECSALSSGTPAVKLVEI